MKRVNTLCMRACKIIHLVLIMMEKCEKKIPFKDKCDKEEWNRLFMSQIKNISYNNLIRKVRDV